MSRAAEGRALTDRASMQDSAATDPTSMQVAMFWTQSALALLIQLLAILSWTPPSHVRRAMDSALRAHPKRLELLRPKGMEEPVLMLRDLLVNPTLMTAVRHARPGSGHWWLCAYRTERGRHGEPTACQPVPPGTELQACSRVRPDFERLSVDLPLASAAAC